MAKSVHDIAVRLVEGGIEEVDGLSVKLGHKPLIFPPCSCCEMDSLCHQGSKMCELCVECDSIKNEDCFLILMDKKQ